MSFSQIIFVILILKMMVGCSGQSESTLDSCFSRNEDLIIIGQNDWIHHTLTGSANQDFNELAVGQVTIPKIYAKCTGFLINEDTLMTNNHCIPDKIKSEGVSVHFRNTLDKRIKFDCSEFLMTSSLLDFTLVRCKDKPGREFGWLGLSRSNPVLNQEMYLVQENCDYIRNPRCVVDKFVSFGKVLKLQSNRVYHDGDTLGGSSGSPIFFTETQQVLAIHNSGYFGGAQESDMNLGVPMSQIVSLIQNTINIQLYEEGAFINSNDLPEEHNNSENPVNNYSCTR